MRHPKVLMARRQRINSWVNSMIIFVLFVVVLPQLLKIFEKSHWKLYVKMSKSFQFDVLILWSRSVCFKIISHLIFSDYPEGLTYNTKWVKTTIRVISRITSSKHHRTVWMLKHWKRILPVEGFYRALKSWAAQCWMRRALITICEHRLSVAIIQCSKPQPFNWKNRHSQITTRCIRVATNRKSLGSKRRSLVTRCLLRDEKISKKIWAAGWGVIWITSRSKVLWMLKQFTNSHLHKDGRSYVSLFKHCRIYFCLVSKRFVNVCDAGCRFVMRSYMELGCRGIVHLLHV